MKFINKTALIIRSISGAGKSYLANQILEENPEGIICCADDYFMVNGVYTFNPNGLGYAHGRCKAKFYQGLLEAISPIIVANTNTVWKEMKDYVELASLADYEIYLAEPQTAWARNAQRCYEKNSHNVPLNAIQRMLNRYEDNSVIIEKAKALSVSLKELRYE